MALNYFKWRARRSMQLCRCCFAPSIPSGIPRRMNTLSMATWLYGSFLKVDCSSAWPPRRHSRKWQFKIIQLILFKCGTSTLRKLKLSVFLKCRLLLKVKVQHHGEQQISSCWVLKYEFCLLFRSFVSISQLYKHCRKMCRKRCLFLF